MQKKAVSQNTAFFCTIHLIIDKSILYIGDTPAQNCHVLRASTFFEAARETAAQEEAEARSDTIKSLFMEAMRLREVTTKPGHIQRYTRLFENWFEPLVGNLPIHELKAIHVAEIIKAMQAGKVLRKLAQEETARYKEKRYFFSGGLPPLKTPSLSAYLEFFTPERLFTAGKANLFAWYAVELHKSRASVAVDCQRVSPYAKKAYRIVLFPEIPQKLQHPGGRCVHDLYRVEKKGVTASVACVAFCGASHCAGFDIAWHQHG